MREADKDFLESTDLYRGEYCIEAVSGYEDYQVRENRGDYTEEKDYAIAGGTNYHEPAIPEQPVTYSVTGVISWNDQDDLWGLRPDSADFLQGYDEAGKNVTSQTAIRTEKMDTDAWTYTIEGLTKGERYILGQNLPYVYYLNEKTDPDGTLKAGDPKAWYVPTCTNLVNYFNEKEKCYDGGYITNLLQEETTVAFTKLWKDGNADITETPDLTFQRMRFPPSLDPVKGYVHDCNADIHSGEVSLKNSLDTISV